MSRGGRIRSRGFIRDIIAQGAFFALLIGCSPADRDPRVDAPQRTTRASSVLPEGVKTLNGAPLSKPLPGPFRFILGGHLYGRHGDDQPRPASTLQRSLASLSDSDADFMVALGDTFHDLVPRRMVSTRAFLKRLPFPVVGVLGNHDNLPRGRWVKEFGAAAYGFRYGPAQFFVLDSEHPEFEIAGEQLDLLIEGLNRAAEDPSVRAIFLLSHRVIWGDTRDLAVAALSSNDRALLLDLVAKRKTGPPFRESLRPLLEAAARQKTVCCLAGDAGAFPGRTHSLFFHREPETGLVFASVGLGDHDEDCLLIVDCDARGHCEFSVLPLGLAAPKDLGRLGPGAWRARLFPEGISAIYSDFLRRP